MKTIKQIADEIGVSKQAVQQKIKKEPLATTLRGLSEIVGNTKYYPVVGENLIKAAFNKGESTKQATRTVVDSATVLASLQGQVNTLTELVTGQQKLLSEQQQSIRELTVALEHTTASLHAAQALHAGTMQKQLTDGEADQPQHDEQTLKKKRGWFGWK